MNIAICDDNCGDVQRLRNAIREYYPDENIVRITDFNTTTALIEAISLNTNFEIIFIEILMPVIDGIETAREVRKFDASVAIVFITSAIEYAVEGYKVDATLFIVKPFEASDLGIVFLKIEARIGMWRDSIDIISGTDRRRLPISDILYIEKKSERR